MADAKERAQALYDHLRSGITTTCRCWRVERGDGWIRGFTDHDEDIVFDGVTFSASSGFSASALEMTTGLAVNNTEAVGALSDAAISEEDIEAGRFDDASVELWLVSWGDPEQRVVLFRGSIGEVSRNDDSFSAELRGVTERLNQPQGRVYQKDCSAILGDRRCGVDTGQAGYFAELSVINVEDARVLTFTDPGGIEDRWFDRGRLSVIDGRGAGIKGWIKSDRILGGQRQITLWQGLRADVRPGDQVRMEAGCDKSAATCALKFGNFLNYRGFPHIPGEDWLTAYPRRGKGNTGASMNPPIVPQT